MAHSWLTSTGSIRADSAKDLILAGMVALNISVWRWPYKDSATMRVKQRPLLLLLYTRCCGADAKRILRCGGGVLPTLKKDRTSRISSSNPPSTMRSASSRHK
jgi:hypothetical protein